MSPDLVRLEVLGPSIVREPAATGAPELAALVVPDSSLVDDRLVDDIILAPPVP